jgi:hypothetical protein
VDFELRSVEERSFPDPAKRVPSGSARTVQRKGAAVSATRAGEGPRKTRPSLSMERSSTSPLRNSAWVATFQNTGLAADTTTTRVRTRGIAR